MASGYQINGTDLDDLCEPYVASKAVNSNNQDLSTFYVNGTAMTDRYQKANTDSWAQVITLPLQRDGVAVKTVAKGCLPTQTKFAEITSPGDYIFKRTDDGITIGNTTYPASHFRNGVVPEYIGVMLCGGGGGAGGWGCDKGDKNGFNITPGGAGGGGGVSLCVVETNLLTKVRIGSGGTFGGDGSSDENSRPSSGGTGGDGGSSYIYTGNNDYLLIPSGKGGVGGVGDGAKGAGGAGGRTYHNLGATLLSHITGGGGDGGTYASNGEASSKTNFSFTSGAGIPTTTMFSNSATGYSYDSTDSYRASWAGGGCSIGSGATNSSPAGYGGGGASGRNNRTGGNGYCAFYY